MSEIEKDTKAEGGKKCSLWPLAIFCFVIGALVVVGFLESQKYRTEEARLSDELSKVQKELVECQVNQLPKCEVKPNVGFKKPRVKPKALKAPPAPKPVKQAEIKKAFDPDVCGAGTEPVISRETKEGYCRAIPVPVVVQSAPPPVVVPPVVQQVQVPPGCYIDRQGQTMCKVRVQRVVSPQPIFPIFGGYVYDRPREYYVEPRHEERHYHPPVYQPQVQPPIVSSRPPTFNGGPGVTRPGVNSLPPGAH